MATNPEKDEDNTRTNKQNVGIWEVRLILVTTATTFDLEKESGKVTDNLEPECEYSFSL